MAGTTHIRKRPFATTGGLCRGYGTPGLELHFEISCSYSRAGVSPTIRRGRAPLRKDVRRCRSKRTTAVLTPIGRDGRVDRVRARVSEVNVQRNRSRRGIDSQPQMATVTRAAEGLTVRSDAHTRRAWLGHGGCTVRVPKKRRVVEDEPPRRMKAPQRRRAPRWTREATARRASRERRSSLSRTQRSVRRKPHQRAHPAQ